jgi:hypothetical protein
VARPALPGQQHRDRRELKIRVMNISKKDLGKTLKRYKGTAGTRARSSRRSTRKSTASSAASPSAAWSATTLRPHPPDVELLAKWPRSRRGARAVHRRAVARPDADGLWQELANPRDLTKIFTTPEYAAWRSLRERRCEVHRPGDAALPGAPALRRQDQPGRRVQLRGRHRRLPTTASTPGPTRPMRWRSTSTARSRCTAGARASAASSRRCGRRPAGAHLPHRRRRRGHEVPDRDRHQRPARGRTGQERLHAAGAQEEQRLRRLHRRAVAAQAGRVRRSRCHRQRQPGARCRTCSPPAASRTT